MKFYYNPTEETNTSIELSICRLCLSGIVTPGYRIDINGRTLICVGVDENTYYFSFLEILDTCTVAEIDDKLRTLWGDESILPKHLWKEFYAWFIPSEYQVFNEYIYSKAPIIPIEVVKLSYYNEKPYNRIKIDEHGNTRAWWERSPYGSDSTLFCFVNGGGTAGYNDASDTRGLAPVLVLKL